MMIGSLTARGAAADPASLRLASPPVAADTSVSSHKCAPCGDAAAYSADDKGIKLVSAAARVIFRVAQLVSRPFFAVLYGGRGRVAPPVNDPLLLRSACDLARGIRAGEISSVEVVSAFIKRIRDTDAVFNFVVDERFEESLREARIVDERISRRAETTEEMRERRPFLGVPFTFKASISKSGFRCTIGLLSRRDRVADEDADVIALMRNAGAIPIASTNISEYCLWWESDNLVHGRTRNPYGGNRSVGGSSGGEGCAQALAGSPMGLGSDIGGSVRIPAHFNGIFSHKPTNGVTPIRGHLPFPRAPEIEPLLVIGPMCRFARDLAPMLKIIDESGRLRLDDVDIGRLRCFYMEDDGGGGTASPVHADIKAAVMRAVRHLETARGVRAERANIAGLGHSMMIWFASMKAPRGPFLAEELSAGTNLYLEIVKFALGSRRFTLPTLLIAAFERFAADYDAAGEAFLSDLRAKLKADFEEMLGSDGIFIYPTLPIAAPRHGESLTKPFDASYTAIFNCLGFPATHCPMGLDSAGLPIGVQIVAGEFQDRLTLAVAEELEKAFGGWIPPQG